jgi:hypothetical protein
MATREGSALDRRRDRSGAIGLFVVFFLVYNANGREIGSFDTQSTKFAARELLLRHTLALNHVVGATPEYGARWGFINAADGRYRSIYSPVPSLMAAAVTWPLWKAGIVDIRAPAAPALMAKLTASLLIALSTVLAFFIARAYVSRQQASLVALGLGLGTGFWSTASQTLWQTETSTLGLMIAVLAFAGTSHGLTVRRAIAIGIGLALAGVTRPQLAPAVLAIVAGTWLRTSRRNALLASAIISVCAAVLAVENVRWFGHALGALPLLQEHNAVVHQSGASFRLNGEGWLGLLVSPNRGLLIYSPVLLLAAGGIRPALQKRSQSPLVWCLIAAAAQYGLYATYSVWWGGHTYGPRYMLDLLPLLVPIAAVGVAPLTSTAALRAAGGMALAWSVLVAATGAFCYPADQWNVVPTDVDRNHARLWSWSDMQIVRCWRTGVSSQNFTLFDRGSVRVLPMR